VSNNTKIVISIAVHGELYSECGPINRFNIRTLLRMSQIRTCICNTICCRPFLVYVGMWLFTLLVLVNCGPSLFKFSYHIP